MKKINLKSKLLSYTLIIVLIVLLIYIIDFFIYKIMNENLVNNINYYNEETQIINKWSLKEAINRRNFENEHPEFEPILNIYNRINNEHIRHFHSGTINLNLLNNNNNDNSNSIDIAILKKENAELKGLLILVSGTLFVIISYMLYR